MRALFNTLFTPVIAASLALGAGTCTFVGCGPMSAGSIREGGGIRVASPRAYVRAPRGFPAPVSAQDELGREVLRCYEAEMPDPLQYSDPYLSLAVAMTENGIQLTALQGSLSSRGGFANCVTSAARLWDWSQVPRDADGQVLPLEFGMPAPEEK